MAPAGAIAFCLSAAILFTGSALPLAVAIALVVCALVALCIGSLAKHLPSAGGYFTYVSHSLASSVGWITGWLFNLAYLAVVPFTLLMQGALADSFVTSTFHLSLGWAAWATIFAVGGQAISQRTLTTQTRGEHWRNERGDPSTSSLSSQF